MKHIKTFENLNNEETKNKILLVDITPSSIYSILSVLQNVELYLSEKFTPILSYNGMYIIENTTLPVLIEKLNNRKSGSSGGDNVIQNGINYIIKHNMKGRVLIITDGFDYIDIDNLKNKCSILSTDSKTGFKGKKCQQFLYNLEDDSIIYEPRYDTTKDYELAEISNKFNL